MYDHVYSSSSPSFQWKQKRNVNETYHLFLPHKPGQRFELKERRNMKKTLFHIIFWFGESNLKTASKAYIWEKKKCTRRTVCSNGSTFSRVRSERRAKAAWWHHSGESFALPPFWLKLKKSELSGHFDTWLVGLTRLCSLWILVRRERCDWLPLSQAGWGVGQWEKEREKFDCDIVFAYTTWSAHLKRI